jgi:hypothetical protein
MTSATARETSGQDWLVPPNATVWVLLGQLLAAGLQAASPP